MEINEQAILGGGTLVHQFVRIGIACDDPRGYQGDQGYPPYTTIGRGNRHYIVVSISLGAKRVNAATKEQIYIINDIYRKTLYT